MLVNIVVTVQTLKRCAVQAIINTLLHRRRYLFKTVCLIIKVNKNTVVYVLFAYYAAFALIALQARTKIVRTVRCIVLHTGKTSFCACTKRWI